jgi:hypothetical protein
MFTRKVHMRIRFNPAVVRALLLAGTAASVACGTGPQNPAAPGGLAGSRTGPEARVLAGGGEAGADAKQTTVDVCHRTAEGDTFIHLSVAAAAVDSLLKRGDGLVGGPVPGQPGMTFDASCTPIVTGTIITFAGLTDGGASFTTYTESGLTVVSTEGDWEVNTGYGNPEPFIQFPSPAEAPTVTAAITVTAGGALFTFSSVDLYSSLTPIPYVFTGIRDSVTVFTATDTQPDTFGDFATVLNPYSSESIDTLVITLANPPDVCCPNATGLDNISIVTGD